MKDLCSIAASPPAASARSWAICLGRADPAAVGRLRQVADIEVCERPDQIWLRGPTLDEKLHRRIAAVPGAQRFYVLPDGQLQPVASQLPKDRLPSGPWVPLPKWLALGLPPAGLAGRSNKRTPMVLVRSAHSETTSVLLTTIDRWEAYAVQAPQLRLDCWHFAVADDGRVVVRGAPLPPLPGQRWVDREGIAVPAGWRWSPPVDAAIVRAAFGLEPSDFVLWQTDGTWQRIRAADFVPASRAAVRASAEGFRYAAH
ncbi:MAG: hypothetical protein ABSG53_29370 [Thermoguttaceae bacterium]|jgi:hypothetical protein